MLYHYTDQSCPQAARLLEGDPITYSVLIRILQGQCAHIITDLENLILCHSNWPYSVWVWCRDAENEKCVAEIARCIKEKFPLEQGYSHILSHALLVKLRERDEYFRAAQDGMGLLSYRLDKIRDIDYPCDGYMNKVTEEEIDSLLGVWHDMHMEMEGHDLTPEHCRSSMESMVEKGSLFVWRKDNGEIVALTGRGDQERYSKVTSAYSKITSVYTLPSHRRKGYAINLVHGVTEMILADDLIPILYTNADYAASNECYRKIGYRQIGSLTSICK